MLGSWLGCKVDMIEGFLECYVEYYSKTLVNFTYLTHAFL